MKKNDIRTLTRLALLVAIELVMKAVGLGSVPVGPLYMSFLTLPIAVGETILSHFLSFFAIRAWQNFYRNCAKNFIAYLFRFLYNEKG